MKRGQLKGQGAKVLYLGPIPPSTSLPEIVIHTSLTGHHRNTFARVRAEF
jgi:hypothetical protein